MWAIYPSILNRWLTTSTTYTTYKKYNLAIYLFYITHNAHKQAGSGSHGRLALPTTLPTTYPKPSKTTHKTTRAPEPKISAIKLFTSSG
jgi:hypothetical protein